MQVRRAGWFTSNHDLVGDDGWPLARVRMAAFREGGTIDASDGRRWVVRRDPGFGPWRVTDAAGAVVATIRKDGLRERFDLDWPGGRLYLARRANLGRRLLAVTDRGDEVGEIRTRGWSGRTVDLRLPPMPDEVRATVAWLVTMLSRRDASAAAQ